MFGSVPLDGAQAEYVLVPLADTTLYPVPTGAAPETLLLMADVSNFQSRLTYILILIRPLLQSSGISG